MTMDGMVEYLERQGFDTKKNYEKDAQAYAFVISRGDLHLRKMFDYPHWETPAGRDRLQKEFLKDMVEEFERAEENRRENLEVNMYCSSDWARTRELSQCVNKVFGSFRRLPEIKDVIFNEPATIVLWEDGTKTVVKCQKDDIFDPEKGLTMAISKKALGNKGNYCNVIKKWTEKYEVETFLGTTVTDWTESFRKGVESLRSLFANNKNASGAEILKKATTGEKEGNNEKQQ